MKLEHFAVSSNSEEDAEDFFSNLLGLEKTRSFTVSADLIEKFFGIEKEQKLLRFEGTNVAAEVFINKEKSKSTDIFTHVCLVIENRDELIQKAKKRGYPVIKVPRKNGPSYYLFLKDKFGNIYEIKE
jgi:catechol 2,3-dioxygenase-like lactoylglutathione lyase family enzyme